MRIRDRISGAWNSLLGRSAPPGSGSGGTLTGGPYHPDAFGARRAPTPWELVEAYKSIIYFCTNLNASRTAAVPGRLYAKSGHGMARPRRACRPRPLGIAEERRLRRSKHYGPLAAGADEIHEVTAHPFLDLLEDPDPDGYFDRASLIEMIVRYVDVVGTSYHRPAGAGAFPAELWPLQSQYVLPVRRANSALIDRFTYFTESYAFDGLLRIRLRPSLHDPYGAGYAGAQAAIEYARLEDQWVSIQEDVLGAGPRMGLIVSARDATMPIGVDEGAKLERDLNRKFARGGAGRVWVNRTALSATPVTYPPADLAGLDVSEYDLERICNCLDCPPTMFSKEQNLANIQAAKELHASNAVEPRCGMIASAFSRFVRKYDDRLFYAFDDAVKEDEEHRAKLFDLKIRNKSLTINEARAEDGREPVPWGDEPWVPNTERQPSEPRPTPAAPGDAGKPDPDPEPDDEARDDEDLEPARERELESGDADGDGDPERAAVFGRALEVLENVLGRLGPGPGDADAGDRGDRGGPGPAPEGPGAADAPAP